MKEKISSLHVGKMRMIFTLPMQFALDTDSPTVIKKAPVKAAHK